MGHECFETLTGQEIQAIYEQHQIELIEKAKRAFVELMLEHAEVFAQVQTASPMATITQQQVREIFDILQEDSRYKALDRLDQERRLMLLQHLGFVHCPQREHYPSYPTCMDSLVSKSATIVKYILYNYFCILLSCFPSESCWCSVFLHSTALANAVVKQG